MPWEHCEVEILDDEPCPSCGTTKDAWTLQFDVTRSFKVTRRPRARFVLLDERSGEPLVGAPFELRFPDGSQAEGVSDEYGQANVGAPAKGAYELRLPRSAPGDVLSVEPEVAESDPPAPGEEAGAAALQLETGVRYTIQLRCPFEVAFLERGEPLAGAPYRLRAEGGLELSGVLDGEGLLRVELPAGVGEVEVEVGAGLRKQRATLRVGGLEPAEDARGAQQRLNNLGLDCGEVDGDLGPVTSDRLRHLQRRLGIAESGALDAETLAGLTRLHGS